MSKLMSKSKILIRSLNTLLVLAALVTPIAIYVSTFGIGISHDHQRWAEMGSAMAGIYSPLIALLALVVLRGQLHLQKLISNFQTDQTYIEQSRADIQYYLDQLDKALEIQVTPGKTLRQQLNEMFQHSDLAAIQSKKLQEAARRPNRQYPRPLDIWGAIYPILASLDIHKGFPYQHHVIGTKQKMIVMSSYETCVALDNYHWCISEGKVIQNYKFSPLLAK